MTFLHRVVADVLANYPDFPPENMRFVVPNQRAILFLKKYFAQLKSAPCIAPKFLSIQEFMEEVSQCKKIPELSLLFEFYDTYQSHCPTPPDDFQTFMGWGKILLQDFNEIDQYLVEPSKIFPYLKAIKEVEHWSVSEELTPMQKKHLAFWNTLGDYYHAFTQKMTQRKQGYQGFLARKTVERLGEYLAQHKNKLHIFVGFNALTYSEEVIIQQVLEEAPSEIYWDIDREFVENPQHDAGFFVRKYFKHWKYFQHREPKWLHSDFSSPKKIQITGVPKNVNQAHYATELVRQTLPEHLEKTALILADEDLFLPLVNSLSSLPITVNITMGYPLKQTPVSELFRIFFRLHFSDSWYYKEVGALLSQPLIKRLLSERYVTQTLRQIQQKNRIFITQTHLKEFATAEQTPALEVLFPKEKISAQKLVPQCIKLIFLLKKSLEKNKEQNAIELEYLYQFYELFNQLEQLVQQFPFACEQKTLYHLYNDFLSKQKLDFQGEPLQGLQLMGMLESRTLDFENLIITSVNEGVLPSGNVQNSFIPFDVKNNVGLPTYKQRDAVFAYHFYRLLQRSQNVELIYNTEADGSKASEKSRFLMQLLCLDSPSVQVQERIITPKISSPTARPLLIEKDEKVMQRLQKIATETGFSPSALTTYIRNPIDFYQRSILGVTPVQEVEEIIENRSFGNIIHGVLEEFYAPFLGKIISGEEVKKRKKEVPALVLKHFEALYEKSAQHSGKNSLIISIISYYLEKFLTREEQLFSHTQVELLALEAPLQAYLPLEKLGIKIKLKGIADRIEKRNGVLHIVDYKTGKVTPNNVEIKSTQWGELISDFKYSKAFQLLMYAYMVKEKFPNPNEILAGNYSFKNLEAGLMFFTEKIDKEKQTAITAETLQQFEQMLKTLFTEIFNPEIPFSEKQI